MPRLGLSCIASSRSQCKVVFSSSFNFFLSSNLESRCRAVLFSKDESRLPPLLCIELGGFAKVECAITEDNQFSTPIQYFPIGIDAEEYERQEEQSH